MDESKERLLEHLASILALHPEGIKEYALVRLLKQENIPPFADSSLSDPLHLFHVHFLLFHCLYLLKSRMITLGTGDLEIHCLNIRLIPLSQSQGGDMTRFDPLQSYYLDLSHLDRTTRDDVSKMIDTFWQQWDRHEKRAAACTLLDLPEDADSATIKRRYRHLAKIHHPDIGGDGKAFANIAAAVAVLLTP
ncbi:MAG: DnaJ domain-containing protein [Magnetococcales bacterium]|nr:DnaJ domain-containing protein [Magnetococcales bacterium]